MPIPQHGFDLRFNIIRSSNAVVRDLRPSRALFETTIGLHVEDRYDDVLDRRGSAEHQHHALLLRKARPVRSAARPETR